jgi:hypothetical protein
MHGCIAALPKSPGRSLSEIARPNTPIPAYIIIDKLKIQGDHSPSNREKFHVLLAKHSGNSASCRFAVRIPASSFRLDREAFVL